MISMRDAMLVVVQIRRRDIVLASETSITAWADVTDDVTLDLPIPAMSKGGVALGQGVDGVVSDHPGSAPGRHDRGGCPRPRPSPERN